MDPTLTLENVFMDFRGKLRRGSVDFTPTLVCCKPKMWQRHLEVQTRHLMKIEDVFLGSRQGIKMTTALGDLVRFGPLSSKKLESTRKFMSVHWRKRILALDKSSKRWIIRDSDMAESKQQQLSAPSASDQHSSSSSTERISEKLITANKKWPIKSVKAKMNFDISKNKHLQELKLCKHSPKAKRFHRK